MCGNAILIILQGGAGLPAQHQGGGGLGGDAGYYGRVAILQSRATNIGTRQFSHYLILSNTVDGQD